MRPGLAGAALLAALLAGPSARAQDAPRYDLVAVSVRGPVLAVAGATATITATFASRSSGDPPPFLWSAVLITDGTLAGAIPLGTFGPLALGALETRSVVQVVSLPAGVAGRYALAVTADPGGQVAEFDELDNTVFADLPTSVRLAAPDVRVRSVRAEETRRRAGEPLHLDFALENRGERAATVAVTAYLSPHPTISTLDPVIGTATVTVSAGGSAAGTIAGVVPAVLAAGDHAAGVIVDAAGALAGQGNAGATGVAPVPVDVYSDRLTLETRDLPRGAVGLEYWTQLVAAGGDGHDRFALAAGAFPTGLALDPATGILSGVPLDSGSAALTVAVTSGTLTATRTLTLEILPTGARLTVVNRSFLPAALGVPYEQLLVAAGGEPPYAWTVTGTLPAGLALDPRAGTVAGTPAEIGTFAFGVTVRDHLGATATSTFAVTVAAPANVLVSPEGLPPVVVGSTIAAVLEATGGVPPYTWSAVSSLPSWLALSPDGRLSGRAGRVGTFPVRVQATDASQAGNADTALVTVVVRDDGALRIVTSTLPVAHSDVRWSAPLEARGGALPLTWSIAPGDAPPAGFFLVPGDGKIYPADDGVLEGAATGPDAAAFSAQVEDAAGRRAARVFVLRVAGVGSSCRCASPWAATPVEGLALLAGLSGLLISRLLLLLRWRRRCRACPFLSRPGGR